MEYSILTIFTHYGNTFTFRNVRVICNNETTLQFNYVAMSDGVTKTATFPKPTLRGWTVAPN